MSEHVIATDPGGRSGFASAVMSLDSFELTGSGVLREDLMPDWFASEQALRPRFGENRFEHETRGPRFDVFVYESWYPRRDEQGKLDWIEGDNLAEAQQIGALRWIARASGTRIVTQHPSDKKMAARTMPDALKVLDRDSNEQHDQDARMHLWLYFWRNWFSGKIDPERCVRV